MNVSKILDKILNEQEVNQTAKGLNYEDTYQVLLNAKAKCPTLKFLGSIKQMTSTSPMDGNVPLLNKFTEIYNLKSSAVAYAGGMNGNEPIIVFGIVDPSTQSGKPGFYAYTLINGRPAIKITNGAGSGCSEIQKREDVGQANLSEYNKNILQSFINKYGSTYTLDDMGKSLNYKRVPLKDLLDDGKPLGFENNPQGFVYMKTKGGSGGTFVDNAEETNAQMLAQGFTNDQKDVNDKPDLLRLGFYLKDVKNDLPQVKIGPNMALNVPYWPLPINSAGIGVIVDPTRNDCRNLVKKLKACRDKDRNVSTSECLNNLFARKLSTINCNRKKMFLVGGILGLKDDFESLMGDTGQYGLANLASGLGKVKEGQNVAESTLDFKINNLLNEEHKKFSFSDKKKINFDKNLIENISTQLVLSAYHDLERDMKKFNRLNENVFSNITGALGFNLADGLTQGLKETILRKALKYLGFDTKSYIGLLVINTFANLEIADYREFFTNCTKFTKIIVKSALEAWLDLAMQKIGKSGGFDVEGIVYAALKNVVTETASNTSVFMRLENMAKNIVCPIVENIGSMIGDKLGV